MGLLKKIRNLLFLFVIIAAGTAYWDYYQMRQGNYPIFCKDSYVAKTKIETCRGIFYIAERKVKQNTSERLELSKNIKYKVLNQTLKINLPRPKEKKEFVLLVHPNNMCGSSTLYYEWDDHKLYLDCIASIRVKNTDESKSQELNEALDSNPSLVEDILMNLSFMGKDIDGITERYAALDDQFSTKRIIAYRCHNGLVNDIYLTLNPAMALDYCTLKNDTLKVPEVIPGEVENTP